MDNIEELRKTNKFLALVLMQLDIKLLTLQIARDRIQININENLIKIEENKAGVEPKRKRII